MALKDSYCFFENMFIANRANNSNTTIFN